MAEELIVPKDGSKEEKYKAIIPQIHALVEGETNRIANVSNIMAVLKETFRFWWVGVYMVEGDELVLGPFQGPVACTRIANGKGVCGTSWAKGETIVVEDVDAFPGHIACSSASRSEIVVPIIQDDRIIGVLDVDSEFLSHFDQTDKVFLEEITAIIAHVWK